MEQPRSSVSTAGLTASLGSRFYYNIHVRITYSGSIHENETLKIHAQVSQQHFKRDSDQDTGVVTEPLRYTIKSLERPFTITLSGLAFAIDPKVQSFKNGVDLPAKASWTASAKGTGSHTLQLDWSSNEPEDGHGLDPVCISKISVNKGDVNLDNGFPVQLPVEVFTKWGISQLWADIISHAITLIGFILTLPILSGVWDWVQRHK